MSRIKKTLLNAKVNLIFYVLSTFVAFFTRKIFLDYLGDEFVGLTGTIKSILGFLNLTELGIGTAIGFALYKPLFDNDQKEINKLISLFGFLYKKVGLIVLGLAVIVSFFFPLIFEKAPFSLPLVYYCFFAFLMSSLLGYFANYHQSLLNADQRGYLISGYIQTANLCRHLLQAYIAYKYQNLFVWITLELVFSIFYSLIIRYRIKKVYPWLNLGLKSNSSIIGQYPVLIEKIKQLFVHKISSFITFGTDQILIFSLVNIQSVAFVGNYNLIITQIVSLIQNLFGGTAASVGNLVAEDNFKLIKKVFWEMMAIRFFIAGLIIINLYFVLDNFIFLWLGERYILDNYIVWLMIFNLFMVIVRVPVGNFANAYGLFADTWAPIAEIFINLIISIVFGLKWGIVGIMLGTSVSSLVIVMFWKPYYLFKNGFRESVLKNYWIRFIKLLVIVLFAFYLIYFFNEKINFVFRTSQLSQFLLNLVYLNLIIMLIFYPTLSLLSQGFKDFNARIKSYLINKINHKSNH